MRYCKAFLLKDLRQFKDWSSLSKDQSNELKDDHVVYMLENFMVTTNPLDMDCESDYILKSVTDEWEDFCKTTLKFEVPDWEAESQAVREALASAGTQS